MNVPFIADRELDPIEIDPRPCERCGMTIDRHFMIDAGEGPEFFCDTSAADLVRQWEVDDPRDRWRWTGEAPPPAHVRNADISPRPVPAARPYHPPEATVNAFLYVASLDDPDHLARWLADHKRDAPHLLKIWKAKRC
jgi:hypothetical protein